MKDRNCLSRPTKLALFFFVTMATPPDTPLDSMLFGA